MNDLLEHTTILYTISIAMFCSYVATVQISSNIAGARDVLLVWSTGALILCNTQAVTLQIYMRLGNTTLCKDVEVTHCSYGRALLVCIDLGESLAITLVQQRRSQHSTHSGHLAWLGSHALNHSLPSLNPPASSHILPFTPSFTRSLTFSCFFPHFKTSVRFLLLSMTL